ncbi:hypothetical protein P7C70_g7563, partial [Phenoliferia sp. Uapishka_3]
MRTSTDTLGATGQSALSSSQTGVSLPLHAFTERHAGALNMRSSARLAKAERDVKPLPASRSGRPQRSCAVAPYRDNLPSPASTRCSSPGTFEYRPHGKGKQKRGRSEYEEEAGEEEGDGEVRASFKRSAGYAFAKISYSPKPIPHGPGTTPPRGSPPINGGLAEYAARRGVPYGGAHGAVSQEQARDNVAAYRAAEAMRVAEAEVGEVLEAGGRRLREESGAPDVAEDGFQAAVEEQKPGRSWVEDVKRDLRVEDARVEAEVALDAMRDARVVAEEAVEAHVRAELERDGVEAEPGGGGGDEAEDGAVGVQETKEIPLHCQANLGPRAGCRQCRGFLAPTVVGDFAEFGAFYADWRLMTDVELPPGWRCIVVPQEAADAVVQDLPEPHTQHFLVVLVAKNSAATAQAEGIVEWRHYFSAEECNERAFRERNENVEGYYDLIQWAKDLKTSEEEAATGAERFCQREFIGPYDRDDAAYASVLGVWGVRGQLGERGIIRRNE